MMSDEPETPPDTLVPKETLEPPTGTLIAALVPHGFSAEFSRGPEADHLAIHVEDEALEMAAMMLVQFAKVLMQRKRQIDASAIVVAKSVPGSA